MALTKESRISILVNVENFERDNKHVPFIFDNVIHNGKEYQAYYNQKMTYRLKRYNGYRQYNYVYDLYSNGLFEKTAQYCKLFASEKTLCEKLITKTKRYNGNKRGETAPIHNQTEGQAKQTKGEINILQDKNRG